MNINYSIESFRKEIYDIINNCQLPIGTVYFIFKDIFGDISQAYQAAVNQEAQAKILQAQQQLNKNAEDMDFDEKE